MHQLKPRKVYKFPIFTLTFLLSSTLLGQFPLSTRIGNIPNSSISGSDTLSKDSSKILKKKNKAKYYPLKLSSEKLWFNLDTFNYADSTSREYHWYTQNQRSKIPMADLGIPSSPSTLLVIKPEFEGLNSGLTIHKTSNFTPKNFIFNRVGQPFTEFKYIQGDGLFIGLEALHTQNFSKTWNITVNYRTFSNEALYSGSNQDNLSRNIGIGSHFESQNKRYLQQIVFTWNRYKRIENGGLSADSLFYGPDGAQVDGFGLRKFGFYNPRLESAKSVNNYLNHSFKHRYFLDTLRKTNVFQEIGIDRVNYNYIDLSRDTLYYGKNFNFDSTEVNDSNTWNKFNHLIGIGFEINKIKMNFGYLYEQLIYRYSSNSILRFENKYQNHGLTFNLSKKFSDWQLFSNNEYYISGYSKNNYSLNIFVNKKIDSSSQIGIHLSQTNQNWNIFQTTFLSNHFSFQLNQDKNTVSHTNFGLEYNKSLKNIQFNISTNGGYIQNPIMILEDLRPKTVESFIFGNLGFDLIIKLNKFHILTNLYLQKYNTKELNNFGLPVLFGKFGVYFQENLFKGSLLFKTGLEGFYTSKYNGIEYRPDLPSFSLNRNITLGNYPILDFFVSGQIQTVNIFLKFEHLNEWYIIPNVNERMEDVYKYPIQPFRFRFGFVWKFWN